MTLTETAEQPGTEHDPALGTRELKKQATRRALVAAAQELVLEHGLDAVTVDDICARVGVARRTFFNYFESKDDAAIGWHGEIVPQAAATVFVAGGPTGLFGQDARTLVRAILSTHEFDVDEARRKGEIARREPKLLARQIWWFEQETRKLVDLLVARDANVPGPASPAVGAAFVFTLVRMAFRLWEDADHRGTVVDHLDEAADQLRRTFCAD